MSVPQKESFRPDEVAVLLGVSRRTVFRWLKKGVIQGVYCRGHKRIPRHAILSMMTEKGRVTHVSGQMDG